MYAALQHGSSPLTSRPLSLFIRVAPILFLDGSFIESFTRYMYNLELLGYLPTFPRLYPKPHVVLCGYCLLGPWYPAFTQYSPTYCFVD